MTTARFAPVLRRLAAATVLAATLLVLGAFLGAGFSRPGAAASAAVEPRSPGAADLISAGAQTATAGEATSQTLVVNLGGYPGTLDPQMSSYVNELAHLKMLYEGLTRLDDRLQTVPGAAESWQFDAAGTVLTFTLRGGLTYSDGSVLNAERFRYAILRTTDPETGAPYGGITDDIAGAAEWRSGSGSRAGVALRALDLAGQPCTGYAQAGCRLLVMHLRHPAIYFPSVLSMAVVYPAKEENIVAGGSDWWQSPQYQVGNGPFVLQTLAPGERSHLAPNSHYWRGAPAFNLEYRYIADGTAALTQYKYNHLDVTAPAASSLAEIRATPTLSRELVSYTGSCTYGIMFHNLKPPFNDPKVRAAFAYAFDREAWARDVLHGGGSATLTWIPRGYPGYDAQESRWAYNPVSATQALADSSYGGIASLPPITATFVDAPANRVRWEWLAARWHAVLGVDLALEPVTQAVYSARMQNPQTVPQLFLLNWCADYPDPQNWLSIYWKTGGLARRIGYSNPAVDALLDQADGEVDPATRLDLYMQAQRLVTADVPAAYAWNNLNAFLVKGRVKGFVTTPQDSDWAGSNDPLTISVDAWKRLYLPGSRR